MPFEINTPLNGLLNGSIGASITEVGGVNPIGILEADKPFQVNVNWTLSGPLTPFVAGTWHVSVFLESIGPGAELQVPLPSIAIPLTPGVGPVNYSHVVNVPANTVTVGPDGRPYKLVTTVTYRTVLNKPGPMAAFVEAPVVQFYRDDV